jgi:hypothetical protein
MERYITNGVTHVPWHGIGVVPKGCREISKQEFDAAMRDNERREAEIIQVWQQERADRVISIKGKLIAGEPLTPEEADFLLG